MIFSIELVNETLLVEMENKAPRLRCEIGGRSVTLANKPASFLWFLVRNAGDTPIPYARIAEALELQSTSQHERNSIQDLRARVHKALKVTNLIETTRGVGMHIPYSVTPRSALEPLDVRERSGSPDSADGAVIATDGGPLVAVIGSAISTLPSYRADLRDALERLGVVADFLDNRQTAAIPQRIEAASCYVFVIGHRLGAWSPDGRPLAHNELERARSASVPIFGFVMHDEHPIPPTEVAAGKEAEWVREVRKFTATYGDGGVVRFTTPADLRSKVIETFADLTAERRARTVAVRKVAIRPPKPYVAHSYDLLTTRLVGREAELKLLDAWHDEVRPDLERSPILAVTAIGGTGKSALAWRWFGDRTNGGRDNLAGAFWWSFYARDVQREGYSFAQFMAEALAYVSGMTLADAHAIDVVRRAQLLVAALDERPFLIVLDGIERLLLAYSSRALASATPSQDYDAEAIEPSDADLRSDWSLREFVESQAASFFLSARTLTRSRILVTTRVMPRVLETSSSERIKGVRELELSGLSGIDAVALFREHGVRGSADRLEDLARRMAAHPLLIGAIAGAINKYRAAPGDADAWLDRHPRLTTDAMAEVRLEQARILRIALGALVPASRAVGRLISYGTAAVPYALLCDVTRAAPYLLSETDLDRALSDLEDRTIVTWDRDANTYDMHPVIRDAVWGDASASEQGDLDEQYSTYLSKIAPPPTDSVTQLAQLAESIQYFHTLIRLRRFNEAWKNFRTHLLWSLRNRLCLIGHEIQLISELVDAEASPEEFSAAARGDALSRLVLAYRDFGLPNRARACAERCEEVNQARPDVHLLFGSFQVYRVWCEMRLGNLEEVRSRLDAAIPYWHERAEPFYEGIARSHLGALHGVTGDYEEAVRALDVAVGLVEKDLPSATNVWILRTRVALCSGKIDEALRYSAQAIRIALRSCVARSLTLARTNRAATLVAALEAGVTDRAAAIAEVEALLPRAESECLRTEFGDCEISVLLVRSRFRLIVQLSDLAEQDALNALRKATRGGYVPPHAEAQIVLARIFASRGDLQSARTHALLGLELASCRGQALQYSWLVQEAERLLATFDPHM